MTDSLVFALLVSAAVPPDIGRVAAAGSFKYLTLFFLLSEKNLRFISVWSPTFLLLLLEDIESLIPSLIRDIETGALSLPDRINSTLYESLLKDIKPQRDRASVLRKIWINGESTLADKILSTKSIGRRAAKRACPTRRSKGEMPYNRHDRSL